MSVKPDQLLEYLETLGIRTTTINHVALHTVAESQALRVELPGAHIKNLFVKDKKSRLFVISSLQDTSLDLKQMHHAIGGQGRVSFADSEVLAQVWGVTPGSVTPFGAINDVQGRVTQVLDEELMDYDIINCHPLTNTRTTSIARTDLLAFLKATRHEPLIARLPRQN